MQGNEAFRGSDANWRLTEARFNRPGPEARRPPAGDRPYAATSAVHFDYGLSKAIETRARPYDSPVEDDRYPPIWHGMSIVTQFLSQRASSG